MIQDKNHRPGVSVTLSVEILKPCYAGDTIRLVSRCDKIGKSIAFSSLELRSTSGDLLARGKHIKYVKMGFVWDLLTSFFIFPLMLMFLEHVVAKKKIKCTDATAVASFEPGHVFKALNLGEVEDGSLVLSVGPTGSKKEAKPLKTIHTLVEGEKGYTLRVNSSLSNVLGHMHGGAIAAAAEEASRRQMALTCKKSGQPAMWIDSMEVTYKSPSKVRFPMFVGVYPLKWRQNNIISSVVIV